MTEFKLEGWQRDYLLAQGYTPEMLDRFEEVAGWGRGPMDEPTEFGARVMTDDGMAILADPGDALPWTLAGYQWMSWSELQNPRPMPDEGGLEWVKDSYGDYWIRTGEGELAEVSIGDPRRESEVAECWSPLTPVPDMSPQMLIARRAAQ